MTELLDLDIFMGTPLEGYLGDPEAYLEDDEANAPVICTEHRELVRVIQALVMAGKVSWDDVGKAMDFVRKFN